MVVFTVYFSLCYVAIYIVTKLDGLLSTFIALNLIIAPLGYIIRLHILQENIERLSQINHVSLVLLLSVIALVSAFPTSLKRIRFVLTLIICSLAITIPATVYLFSSIRNALDLFFFILIIGLCIHQRHSMETIHKR